MSTSPTAIPKVRTYAADLNSVRETKPTPVTSIASTPVSVPAPQAIVTKSIATQTIPPFHTFSKNERSDGQPETTTSKPARPSSAITSNSQAETQKILTASSSLQAAGNFKESLPAVIITDTKHKRFKLSEALAHSVLGWWNDKKQSAQQKKIPKYTVPVAERRKGVIQKATAKTGRESSADHAAVVNRIKATKQIPHGTTVSAPKLVAQKNVTPAWDSEKTSITTPVQTGIQNDRIVKRKSSIGEAVVPPLNMETLATHHWETDIQTKANALTDTTQSENSSIILSGKEFTRIKEARSKTPVTAVATAITAGSAASSNRVITPVVPPQIAKSVVSSTSTFVAPTSVIRPQTPSQPVITSTPRNIVVPTIPTTPITTSALEPVTPASVQIPITRVQRSTAVTPELTPEPAVEERRFAPPREPKRDWWSMVTQTNPMVFITVGILVLVVGSGLGLRAYQNTPAPIASEAVPATEETAFPGSANITETNFYTDKTQLSERLKTQTTDTDSLTEITFINETGAPLSAPDFLTLFGASVPFDFTASINNIRLGNYRGAPWILLTISDKNTALGGMLSWETSMGSNLAPIFSTTPVTSYDRFTDSIINGTDVRVMKNESGIEEIVYGFVGYDTLLITSNTTAFLNLAQNIY
ncbi:hypothetical protein K2P47_05140 [Patescibacteria group bacterium]|nr:hypothetical protein [Patescibacteria group bacterium]